MNAKKEASVATKDNRRTCLIFAEGLGQGGCRACRVCALMWTRKSPGSAEFFFLIFGIPQKKSCGSRGTFLSKTLQRLQRLQEAGSPPPKPRDACTPSVVASSVCVLCTSRTKLRSRGGQGVCVHARRYGHTLHGAMRCYDSPRQFGRHTRQVPYESTRAAWPHESVCHESRLSLLNYAFAASAPRPARRCKPN